MGDRSVFLRQAVLAVLASVLIISAAPAFAADVAFTAALSGGVEGTKTGSTATGDATLAVHVAAQTVDVTLKVVGIKFADWKYPVVVKDNGTVAYDNYNGSWGDIARLNELKAYYGLEKAKIEARRAGRSVYESVDEQTNDLVLRISI